MAKEARPDPDVVGYPLTSLPEADERDILWLPRGSVFLSEGENLVGKMVQYCFMFVFCPVAFVINIVAVIPHFLISLFAVNCSYLTVFWLSVGGEQAACGLFGGSTRSGETFPKPQDLRTPGVLGLDDL